MQDASPDATPSPAIKSRLLKQLEKEIAAATSPMASAGARAKRAMLLARHGAVGEAREALTALHQLSFQHPHPEIGAWLLRKGAQVDARADDGTTPLMKLCNRLRADLAVARLYLEAGADANARNDKGRTALHGAARRGQAGIAALLLEYGADPRARNAKGETPRQKAARLRQRAVVSALESAR